MWCRRSRAILFLACAALGSILARAATENAPGPLPYRFLVVIGNQWSDPSGEVIVGGSEFSMICALLKSWGLPFDIHRLDQQRFDAYHLLDRNGRPRHGTILWSAPGVKLDGDASALLRSMVREHGVGLVSFSDAVQTEVIAALAGVVAKGTYESGDSGEMAGEHFIARGVELGVRPTIPVTALLRNKWTAADKASVAGHEVTLASDTQTVIRRGPHPWLTARAAAGGRVVWMDAERTTGQIQRAAARDLLKRALVWVNGYALYAEYPRAVMLSMDDMGAADKTFYPGWHYPSLSEQTIREHIIEPLRKRNAVMVQNVVTGFVDRKTRRVLNAWTVQREDELDAQIHHDFASTKRGLDAGVKAGVFEIQSHGWTHLYPDLDSPPGPLWSADPRGPVVKLNWYKEFGDYIRKAEIPFVVQRAHLERSIEDLQADFGVRPLAMVCGGGLSSLSPANNTMRLAAKLGFGFAQPESAYYVGSDVCVPLEPIMCRLAWNYTAPVRGEEIPWTIDAPIFFGFHDRDVAMDAGSVTRLLEGLGEGVRFMTFAEYCGYLHANVRRTDGVGLELALDYDSHYCGYFATHESRWTLHVADELRRELSLTAEKKSVDIPKGTGRHRVRMP